MHLGGPSILPSLLRQRLQTTQLRYPSYSVRAFARHLGVSPTTLCLVLSGKRQLSEKATLKLCEKLNLSPEERSQALQIPSKGQPLQYALLSQDQYEVIADWRAFAILNLLKTKDFKPEMNWVAKRLGIKTSEVRSTVERLERLKMLKRTPNAWTRLAPRYDTTHDIANVALRRSHEQTLSLAQVALENQPINERDFSWLTLSLPHAALPAFKTKIRKFQDEIIKLAEKSGPPDEVYRLAVQFFALSKKPRSNENEI